jgi:hypothetical protein
VFSRFVISGVARIGDMGATSEKTKTLSGIEIRAFVSIQSYPDVTIKVTGSRQENLGMPA